MVMDSGFTMSLPIVVATAVPEKAPNPFIMAAIGTAITGGSTRVDTTVAIAFGASVQPLKNSAARTRMRTRISTGNASGMLQYYTLQHIANILAPICGVLQFLVDLPPLNDIGSAGSVVKKFGEGQL